MGSLVLLLILVGAVMFVTVREIVLYCRWFGLFKPQKARLTRSTARIGN